MKKLIYILFMICASIAFGADDYAPVMVNTNTGQFAFGGTNGANTNVQFTVLDVGNMSLTTNGLAVTNNFGWEDLRFSASSAAKLNPSADVVANVPENAVDYKTSCDTNITDEHIYLVTQLPHLWNIGGDIGPHVHFLQTNSDQTNMWYMWCRWINRAATNDTWVFIGPATNEYAYTSGTMHQVAEFDFVSGAGMTASSLFDVKIMRDGNFGTGTVPLKEFDLHYEVKRPTGQVGVYGN